MNENDRNALMAERLESENYSSEMRLGRENKRTLEKMFKYIKKFPISAYEVETIRKDMIGMAAEAEQRGQLLWDNMDGDIPKFCEELVCAHTGMEIPKGWKMLHISGTILMTIGIFNLCIGGWILTGVIVGFLQNIDAGKSPMVFFNDPFWKGLFPLLIEGLIFSVILTIAGKRARKYCADVVHAKQCLYWGIAIGIMSVLDITARIFLDDLSALNIGQAAFTTVINLVMNLILPVFLIIGAKKNLKNKVIT